MILSQDVLGFLYLLVALAGALVALLAWRGSRGGRDRWCPQCDLDMSGSTARTCPSCGYHSTNEQSFREPHRRWAMGILGLTMVTIASMLVVGSGLVVRTSGMLGPTWSKVESQSLPGGLVAIQFVSNDSDRTNFRTRVRILDGKESLFDWRGWSASLGFFDRATAERAGLGDDLDRNGEPDLAFRVHRNADDPGAWIIVSLADRTGATRIQPMAVLDDGFFEDFNGDGRFEFVATDSRLRNRWNEPRRIRVPEIVMSPAVDGWSFNQAMTINRPWPGGLVDPDEALQEASKAWDESRRPFITELFGIAFELMARGRGDDARRLVSETWPGDEDPDDIGEFLMLTMPSGESVSYQANPSFRTDLLDRVMSLSRFQDQLQDLDSPSEGQ